MWKKFIKFKRKHRKLGMLLQCLLMTGLVVAFFGVLYWLFTTAIHAANSREFDEIMQTLVFLVIVVCMYQKQIENSLYNRYRKAKWEKNISGRKNAEKYDDLPHFGKLLNKSQVMRIIKNAEFSEYKTKRGEKLANVLVSEDDKWMCILDGYMPVDFICGYNEYRNELYSIDGGEICLPDEAKDSEIVHDIQAFFEDKGICYTYVPEHAEKRFNDALNVPRSEMDKADFSKVRYLWEKANATGRSSRKNNRYNPVDKKGNVSREIFESVLSDNEVFRTAEAVRQNKVTLSTYLNFNEYKNEFSICNGVAVLEELGYPQNKEGMDFLFDCLGDVDEAYFGIAVNVLLTFPEKMLQEKIEEEAELAYKEFDIVGMAGIMYLAQKLGYTIRYVEEIKKSQNAPTEEIRKFNPDKLPGFADGEIQKFNPSGLAYQEQL